MEQSCTANPYKKLSENSIVPPINLKVIAGQNKMYLNQLTRVGGGDLINFRHNDKKTVGPRIKLPGSPIFLTHHS